MHIHGIIIYCILTIEVKVTTELLYEAESETGPPSPTRDDTARCPGS